MKPNPRTDEPFSPLELDGTIDEPPTHESSPTTDDALGERVVEPLAGPELLVPTGADREAPNATRSWGAWGVPLIVLAALAAVAFVTLEPHLADNRPARGLRVKAP